MSGWKRENGGFVLVLARFRGLEGVRILTISGIFPSLRFKRHPEGILFAIFETLIRVRGHPVDPKKLFSS